MVGGPCTDIEKSHARYYLVKNQFPAYLQKIDHKSMKPVSQVQNHCTGYAVSVF
jgi:hypothetical protein